MASVSLRLPDDVAARLQQLAERTGRSKTFYMVGGHQSTHRRPRGPVPGWARVGGSPRRLLRHSST